jgi:hypothetical protein
MKLMAIEQDQLGIPDQEYSSQVAFAWPSRRMHFHEICWGGWCSIFLYASGVV